MQLPKLKSFFKAKQPKGAGQEGLVIKQIHRNLTVLVIGAVVVGGLIMANLYRTGIIGPIQKNNNPPPVFIWSVSDHTSSGSALANQLGATDAPKYDDNGRVLDLQRNPDGSLVALPRFQATLEYHP